MLAVGHEPETAEVDLALDTRRRVVHPHRRLAPASTTALDGKARQGAVRDIDAAALKWLYATNWGERARIVVAG
jgi:hypothetical protein